MLIRRSVLAGRVPFASLFPDQFVVDGLCCRVIHRACGLCTGVECGAPPAEGEVDDKQLAARLDAGLIDFVGSSLSVVQGGWVDCGCVHGFAVNSSRILAARVRPLVVVEGVAGLLRLQRNLAIADVGPYQSEGLRCSGRAVSFTFSVEASGERNSIITGATHVTWTRWPRLNPARSSQRPMSRIFGFVRPLQKSPSASIFNVRTEGFGSV